MIVFLPAANLGYKSENPRPKREIQRIFKLSLTKSTGAEPRPAAGFNTALLTPPARAVLTALDDSKAEEVVIIDLAGKTSIADWMIIANGRSTTQVGALADRVVKALKEAGAPTPAVEGAPANDWVLIDAGDLIVHLFRPEVRQFYNLEKMWGVDRPGEKRQEA